VKKLLLLPLFLLGTVFLCTPSFALPVLQVYVEGGTAGTVGSDTETWFTSESSLTLQVVVWQQRYTDLGHDEITDLYLLVTVPNDEGAPVIPGLTAEDYTETYPDNHYPVNRGDDFDYYKYMIDDFVTFDTTPLPDYDASTGIIGTAPNAVGHVYPLSVEVAGLTYAHFDAYATGTDYQWKRVGGTWQWVKKAENTEFSPGSHDSAYSPNPVPEPATMLLLGSGLIGLAGLGRKKFLRKS
jgi:hypothetical protein